jgi:hypothetical protein
MKTQEAAKRSGSATRSRATRYEIVTAVRYRVRGESTWQEGLLKNFSISGMLIAATQPLEEGTSIEMRFTLPAELEGKTAADVCSRGFVVRSERDKTSRGTVYIAAKILHSHLLRHSEPE